MAFVNGDKYDDSVTGISENEPLLMKDDKPSDTASSPPGGGGSVDLSCFSSQARRCGAALTRPETLTYMLVAICGMELRVGVTAIAVEMPAMVQVLPESWNLPSIWSLVVIAGNIAPISYMLIRRNLLHNVDLVVLIYIVISIQAASFVLLAFLWDETSRIDASGQSHSVAFICISFLIAACGGLLSLMVMPYLVRFPARALSALLAGSSTGGMILALIAIGQGVNSSHPCAKTNKSMTLIMQSLPESSTLSDVTIPPPKHELNFSVKGFYICISAILMLGILAFIALEHLHICQRVKVQRPDSVVTTTDSAPSSDSNKVENNYRSIDNTTHQHFPDTVSDGANDIVNNILNDAESGAASCRSNTDRNTIEDHHSGHGDQVLNTLPGNSEMQDVYSNQQHGFHHVYLSFGFICILTSVLLSGILTYAGMPYGAFTYSMAQKLQLLVIPIVCMLPVLTPTLRVHHGLALILGSWIPGSYIVYLASVSPNPPLIGSTAGSLLMILATVCTYSLSVFVIVAAAMALRSFSGDVESRLRWFAIADQSGYTIGGVIAFTLIHTGVFHRAQCV